MSPGGVRLPIEADAWNSLLAGPDSVRYSVYQRIYTAPDRQHLPVVYLVLHIGLVHQRHLQLRGLKLRIHPTEKLHG